MDVGRWWCRSPSRCPHGNEKERLMTCDYGKAMRNKLPSYGAWAGAAVAAYFVSRPRLSGAWHPVSTFAESMTVGYLAGFLAAPLIWKPCTDTEKALEAGGSMFGAHPFAPLRYARRRK